ncbi:MAG: ribosome assembly RNA-binding protein YhbY [Eubacteriales bacterium]|jgi:RNA-binding protein
MLTSKQRAQLRGLANPLETIFQIGKGGIGDNLIRQVEDALEARELIKLRVLESSLMTAREACDEICQATGAEPVQTVGTRLVIYKESKKHKKIQLVK